MRDYRRSLGFDGITGLVQGVVLPVVLAALSLGFLVYFQVALILQVVIPSAIVLSSALAWSVLEFRQIRRSIWTLTSDLEDYQSGGVPTRRPMAMLAATATASRERRPLAVDPSPGSLELCLDYKRMEVGHLGRILASLDLIFNVSYLGARSRHSAGTGDESHSSDMHSSSIVERVERLLTAYPQDRLVVDAMMSGNSIVLRAKSGWLPSVSLDEKDLYFDLPIGALVVVYVAVILGGAVKYGGEGYNTYLRILNQRQEQIVLQREEEVLLKQLIDLDIRIREATRENEDHNDELIGALREFLLLTAGNDQVKGVTVEGYPKLVDEEQVNER